MSISVVKPYIKRLQSRKPNLVALVFEHKDSIKNELDQWKLFTEIISAKDNTSWSSADLVVFDFKKLNSETEENLQNIWNKISYNAWVVFFDSDYNRDCVKAFRKDNKITSLMAITNGWIFFQKEDYSNRFVEINSNKPKVEPDTPDWSGSHLKERYLMEYAAGPIFFETGTYKGQTVELVRRSKRHFRKIISVELNKELYEKATAYFTPLDPRITIIQGDSVDVTASVCQEHGIEEPMTFWLDAHASGPLPGGKTGPCPLLQELEAIYMTGRKDHTIFIDDRRLLGTAEWGGVSEDEIMQILQKINPDYNIIHLNGETENDIICATVVVHKQTIDDTMDAGMPFSQTLPSNIKEYFNTRDNGIIAKWKRDISGSRENMLTTIGKKPQIQPEVVDTAVKKAETSSISFAKGKIIRLEDL